MIRHTFIFAIAALLAFLLSETADAGRYGGPGRGYGGDKRVSTGKHAYGGAGGAHKKAHRHHQKKRHHRQRRHVAGWPIQSHYPNPAYCIGSGCSQGLSAWYGHRKPGYRPGHRPVYPEKDPYYGYTGVRRGTSYRSDDSRPIVVVAPPAPARPDPKPTYKTVRNWVPPEKDTVWVPESKSCGIAKEWMGDHWKFSTDLKNCEMVPGRMETVVTRPGYFKEEVVKLTD